MKKINGILLKRILMAGMALFLILGTVAFMGGSRKQVEAASKKTDGSFEKYYKEVLVPKYGVFVKSQKGVMHTIEDEWLKNTGIMGVTVMDFDLDGKKEMMVINAESIDQQRSKIMIKMYENVKGKVKLSSEINFLPYYKGKNTYYSVDLEKSYWSECSLIVNAVKKEKKNYIVFEERQSWGCFADGIQEDYWILQYTKNKLQYVCSLTQTEGGSSGFEYTAYVFKNNGKLKSSKLFFSENEYYGRKGKYKSSSAALKAFFKLYKISLKNKADYLQYNEYGKSILASLNKGKTIFKFENRLYKRDFNRQIYKFKASVMTKNKFK